MATSDLDERCFAFYQDNAYWVAPVERAWLPRWACDHSVGPHDLDYMMSFLIRTTYRSYIFDIWLAHPLNNWCSIDFPFTSTPKIRLPLPDFIFVSTQAQISNNLIDEHFEGNLSEALKKAVGHADNRYPWYTLAGIILVGRTESGYRVLLDNNVHSSNNYPLQEERNRLQEERNRQANLRRADSKRNFGRFVQQHKISIWPEVSRLASNPYTLESCVVGLAANFSAMLDRTTALFVTGRYALAIDGVPSTLFNGDERVLLAARVKGIKDVETQAGVQRAIELEYLGSHICRSPECEEILSWQ